MRRTCSCTLAGIISVLFACWCAAQEIQVPLDEKGHLMVIDPTVEAQLGFFPQYPGFRSAKLLQVSDSSFVLEIEYKPAGEIQVARVPMTMLETQLFRARISGAMIGKVFEVGAEQEGRTAFLLGTAGLSLGYYGWMLPYALDIREAEAFVATYMLTSSAGFFGPLLLTRNRQVTDAAATLSFYGGTRGAVHGVLLDDVFRSDYIDFQHVALASVLTSFGEYAAGFILADRTGMTAGTAEAICAGGDFGLAFGLGTVGTFDIHGDRAAAATILAGSGLGLYGGHLLSRRHDYTRGDAYVLRAAVHLMAYDVFSAGVAADQEGNALVGCATSGGLAGIGLGHYLLRGKDFTTGQAVLVHVGEFTGALFGIGMAFVTNSGEDGKIYWSAAGATAGFFATYYLFSGEAQTPDRGSSLNLELCPEGLLALARQGRAERSLGEALPLVRLRYRF